VFQKRLWLRDFFIHEFDQVADRARKVLTQAIQIVGLHIRPMLVEQFGQGHPIDASGFGNLHHSQAPSFTEFFIGDSFGELETEHGR